VKLDLGNGERVIVEYGGGGGYAVTLSIIEGNQVCTVTLSPSEWEAMAAAGRHIYEEYWKERER
jgi:hypothetical protein